MPYMIRPRKRGVAIVNRNTGKVVAHSSSRQKAQRSINARNAGAHGWKGKSK
jgi:hypothetical protein